jgi:chromate transporter
MITTLIQLALLFSMLSMLALGGGAGVIPDMQRAAVDVHQWMTAREFLDMFAISRAAPGPGSQIVVLIGQKAAGLPGAAVAFVAMFLPSCLVVYLVARGWQRAARSAWRPVVEQALAPVAIGLTVASGLALAQGTETDWVLWVITGVTTVLFAGTRVHPLMLLGGGGVTMLLANL